LIIFNTHLITAVAPMQQCCVGIAIWLLNVQKRFCW